MRSCGHQVSTSRFGEHYRCRGPLADRPGRRFRLALAQPTMRFGVLGKLSITSHAGVRMEIQERINNLMAATVVGTAVEQDLLRAGIITMGTALTATGGTSAPPLVILDTRRTAFFKRFRDQRPNICARYGHAPYDVPLNDSQLGAWPSRWAIHGGSCVAHRGVPQDQRCGRGAHQRSEGEGRPARVHGGWRTGRRSGLLGLSDRAAGPKHAELPVLPVDQDARPDRPWVLVRASR